MLSGPELFVMVLLLNDLYSPLWNLFFKLCTSEILSKVWNSSPDWVEHTNGWHTAVLQAWLAWKGKQRWAPACSQHRSISSRGRLRHARRAEVGSGMLTAPLHLPRIGILTAHMFITDFDTVSFWILLSSWWRDGFHVLSPDNHSKGQTCCRLLFIPGILRSTPNLTQRFSRGGRGSSQFNLVCTYLGEMRSWDHNPWALFQILAFIAW